MTDISESSYRIPKFDNLINLRISTEMLDHISTGAEKNNKNMSEYIRYLLYLGIKSIEER